MKIYFVNICESSLNRGFMGAWRKIILVMNKIIIRFLNNLVDILAAKRQESIFVSKKILF
ncbi:hypothetical protein GCM10022422_20430 [Flavobacterium ginsengisoli]|uniref:Uncharacterized protein n=1 Tax=Flavobacterium ginsengisoli TaxID=871694 RepID=A0ABP7FJ34_9FLAO